MNREDIIRMAREAGFKVDWQHADVAEIKAKRYEYFAAVVAAAEREKLAAWMMSQGYATGHGDTIKDLLKELEWQIKEREREACAKAVEAKAHMFATLAAAKSLAAAIRARSEQCG
jgi:GH25 family lysozyme M1 (1,4-beta-N-acetylmuramidase)